MKKEICSLKKVFALFLMLFSFVGCEQFEFMKILNNPSKANIDTAVLRMKEISEKNSKPGWNVDITTAQYLQFDFNTIEGTEIVKAVYFESNKRLVIARKDIKLKNVIQLYYIKNASLDGEFINFANNSYCEDFLMINLKNRVVIYGENYVYSKDLMESINNVGWINSIIKDKKIKYTRI